MDLKGKVIGVTAARPWPEDPWLLAAQTLLWSTPTT